MAELQYPWPKNSWSILSKIIRAWFAVETGSGELTQKKVADVAGVQASQVSTNKAFLQAIGIVGKEGVALTEAGKRLGIGLYNDNESMKRHGLELIIKGNPLLRDTLDIVRGRGSLKVNDFLDEIALQVGEKTEGFVTGTTILLEILTLSGLVEIKENTLRPAKGNVTEQTQQPEREKNSIPNKPDSSSLNRIPIAVSTSSVWYIEVSETPKEGEIEKFLEMQRLMFGNKQK
jgi:hypothetical protein